MVDAGRPNAFIRNPEPTKREWDMTQSLHPKCHWTSFPLDLIPAQVDSFRRLVFGILDRGDPEEPENLKIQRRHTESMQSGLRLEKNSKTTRQESTSLCLIILRCPPTDCYTCSILQLCTALSLFRIIFDHILGTT